MWIHPSNVSLLRDNVHCTHWTPNLALLSNWICRGGEKRAICSYNFSFKFTKVLNVWIISIQNLNDIEIINFVVMTKENQRKHSGSQFGELQSIIVRGTAVGAWESQALKFRSQEERDERWCWLSTISFFKPSLEHHPTGWLCRSHSRWVLPSPSNLSENMVKDILSYVYLG